MSHAIRLICTFDKEQVTIVSRERIEMLTQAGDPPEWFSDRVGFWLELRDQEGKPLYRQIMRDPFQPAVEVFNPPEEGKVTIAMHPIEEVSGHLVLLVPDEPGADHIALVRAQLDPETKQLTVVDVARLPVATQ